MAVNIEKKYQKLTDTEHVLLRPGMYVGSIKPHTEEVFLPMKGKDQFQLTEVTYNPGFLKLFDEIVSNSVDEHKRNTKLNKVKVNIDMSTGQISIWDNGGIPVKIHKEYDEWVPEMIFSNLKAGSNFDDTEDRVVVGTNGVGSTLTNIFSKEFTIETCDGKKQFNQTFSNNMANRTKPKITNKKTAHTQITYLTDFERFGLKGINKNHYLMITKRLIDIAACNPTLKIFLNDKPIAFRTFKDYASRYVTPVFYEQSEHWKIGIGHSTTGFKAISFVNSVETKDGGTHVNNIGDIDKLAITSVESKGSGIYRVEALTNEGVDHIGTVLEVYNQEIQSLLNKADKVLGEASEKGVKVDFDYKVNLDYLGSYQDVVNKRNELDKVKELVKELDKKIQKELQSLALSDLSVFDQFIDGDKLVARVSGYDSKVLKQIVDSLLDKLGTGVVFIANESNGKIVFVAKSNNGAHCGNLVKEAAVICGGNGGGRPDLAQAGGKDVSKLDEAIEAVKNLL